METQTPELVLTIGRYQIGHDPDDASSAIVRLTSAEDDPSSFSFAFDAPTLDQLALDLMEIARAIRKRAS